MKELNEYIIEKLTIDKHTKIREPKEPNLYDYYLCFLGTTKDKYGSKYRVLHCKWLGAYQYGAEGRKQAEEDSKKYSNFPDPDWKPMGVRTRKQITTLGSKADKYEWY